MMKRLLSRHEKDGMVAARNWMALFGGASNREAMVAGVKFDHFVETVIALGKAFSKGRGRRGG